MSEFCAQSCVNLEILSLSACPGDIEEAQTCYSDLFLVYANPMIRRIVKVIEKQ